MSSNSPKDKTDVDVRVARQHVHALRSKELRTGDVSVDRINICTRDLRETGAGVEVGERLSSGLACHTAERALAREVLSVDDDAVHEDDPAVAAHDVELGRAGDGCAGLVDLADGEVAAVGGAGREGAGELEGDDGL